MNGSLRTNENSFTEDLFDTLNTYGIDSRPRDHVSVGGLKFLNFEYFEEQLRDMPGFEGFTPRWTLITRLRNTTNHLVNTSALFLIIVSNYTIT